MQRMRWSPGMNTLLFLVRQGGGRKGEKAADTEERLFAGHETQHLWTARV